MRYAKKYAQTLVMQRKSELAVAHSDRKRTRKTYASNKHAIALRQLDHDQAAMETAEALFAEVEAQVLEADVAIHISLVKTEKIEVLEMVASGSTNKKIAKKCISLSTL